MSSTWNVFLLVFRVKLLLERVQLIRVGDEHVLGDVAVLEDRGDCDVGHVK